MMKECPECGSAFLPKSNHQKYCDPECAKEGMHRMSRQKRRTVDHVPWQVRARWGKEAV